MIVPRVWGTSEWSERDRSGKFIHEKTRFHLFSSDDSQMVGNTDKLRHCAEQWKTLLHSELCMCLLFALPTSRLHLHSSLRSHLCGGGPAVKCRDPGTGLYIEPLSQALTCHNHIDWVSTSTLVFTTTSCVLKFSVNCECWILSGDSREQNEITKSEQLAWYRSLSFTYLLLPVKRTFNEILSADSGWNCQQNPGKIRQISRLLVLDANSEDGVHDSA